MSKEQVEISFDRTNISGHKINYNKIISRIRSIPNPYVGNKRKLLPFLGHIIEKYDLRFDSFFDAFSGSAVVSLFIKGMGKKVLSNDILTSSYFNSVALIENSSIVLTNDEIEYLLNNNNKNASTFVKDNWTNTTGLRHRFTLNEALQLDKIRANIKDQSSIIAQAIGLTANNLVCMRLPFGFIDRSIDIYNHRKKQIKKYGKNSENHDRRIGIYYDDNLDLNFKEWFPKYIKSLQNSNIINEEQEENRVKMIHAIMFFGIQNFLFSEAFNGGRFNNGQILRNVNDRVKNFEELKFFPKNVKKMFTFSDLSELSKARCLATNSDVIELLKTGFVDVDCVYFDPPYGGSSSDYGSLYRFFEEYIYEDFLENLPHYKYLSRFSQKTNYEKNFCEMLNNSKNIPIWIFSFNESSWNGLEYIVNIIKMFKKDVIIESKAYTYNYRDNEKPENEYLIIAR